MLIKTWFYKNKEIKKKYKNIGKIVINLTLKFIDSSYNFIPASKGLSDLRADFAQFHD